MGKSRWTQIRCTYRSNNVERGVQQRIADPLWMLARQWQFGAFQGDDAASPAKIEVRHSHVPVHTLTPPKASVRAASARRLGGSDLIEAAVEAENTARLPAQPRLSGEAGLQLLRLLPDGLRAAARAALQDRFPLASGLETAPERSGKNARIVAALVRGSFDGLALYSELDGQPRRLRDFVAGDAKTLAQIGGQWIAYLDGRVELSSPKPHWQSQPLEYRFDLIAGQQEREEVRLSARDYGGDGLDWQEFDVTLDKVKAKPKAKTDYMLPSKLAYSGMPSDRLWDMEDGKVWLGGITAEKTSLAQMVLASFATIYSNDWFMVPVPAQRGSLTRVEEIKVHDTFGEVVSVKPCAVKDGKARNWRWFEMTGDSSAERGLAPWLFLPRAAAGGEEGRAVERVYFTRDEAANLAWGIEELVEGAAAQPVDRRQHWNRVRDRFDVYTGIDRSRRDEATTAAAISAQSEAKTPWEYRLVTPVPPHWVPYQPEVTEALGSGDKAASGAVATGRLVRSRLQEWDLLGDAKPLLAGALGKVMDATARHYVADEELMRGGIVVERLYQTARAPDGSLRLWASRRKTPGSGDRPSGRQTDAIRKGEPER